MKTIKTVTKPNENEINKVEQFENILAIVDYNSCPVPHCGIGYFDDVLVMFKSNNAEDDEEVLVKQITLAQSLEWKIARAKEEMEDLRPDSTIYCDGQLRWYQDLQASLK